LIVTPGRERPSLSTTHLVMVAAVVCANTTPDVSNVLNTLNDRNHRMTHLLVMLLYQCRSPDVRVGSRRTPDPLARQF
jgi:hypothetical protein